jgi:hypothetical protein
MDKDGERTKQSQSLFHLASTMPSEYILGLISRMQVRPTPLFQGDVDSNDSHVNNDNDGSDGNAPNAEEMMPTQAPEASGKVDNLVSSIGLLDPEGYVDMGALWEEGSRGEKVCRSGMDFGSSLIACSAFAFRWCTTLSRLGSSVTKGRRRRVAGAIGP